MKLRAIIASAVICSLTMSRPVFADSTIFGSTGLIYNPTADIAPRGKFSLHASYLRENVMGRNQHGVNLSGALGVAPRWEFSLGYVDARIRSGVSLDTSGLAGGLKYLVREEDEKSPAVAVGVQHVNIIKNSTVYVTLSKNLTPQEKEGLPVRGHLGLRFDRVDATRSVTGSNESDVVLYGGFEAKLSRQLHLMGEANTRQSGLAKSPLCSAATPA
jgi:hypothetical protein